MAKANQIVVTAQIDPDIAVIELAAALAAGGFCIRANPESRHLYITYAANLPAEVTRQRFMEAGWEP